MPTLSMSAVRKHFWQRREPVVRRRLRPRKYGLSGCMPARGEQHRRVVLGGHERRRTAAACGRAPRRSCRKRSRISSEVMGRLQSRLQPAMRVTVAPASSTRTAGCGSTRTAPSARTGRPGCTRWVEKPPAAMIVPIDEGPRVAGRAVPPPGRRALLGVPAGRVGGRARAPRRGAGARRAGGGDRAARGRRWSTLGRLYFAYGITNQPVDVWRASSLVEGTQALESTEHDLRVGRFTVSEFEAMIASGEVRDAATVAAWHLATRVA